ncbi:autotransporter domain-containing protein [Candidatus Tisiphia endosymbiont of Mystacides longicornis]|uniref:autotransporter domain-containing protein n=1 Tax=Candidatus Tisiphia endosymbiont of Mystacides longicornis TaxID=3139330 RepID=UPI003CCAC624
MSKKKQKFLKNLLTSVSVASVLASMGWSSVAFAGRGVNTDGSSKLSEKIDAKNGNNDWMILNKENDIIIVDEHAPERIGGIKVQANPGHDGWPWPCPRGDSLIINNNITIGSISGGAASSITARINSNKTLILDGNAYGDVGINTYDKLGSIRFNGEGSTLIIKSAKKADDTARNIKLSGPITTNTHKEGTLIFEGNGEVTGTIGADKKALKKIEIGNGTVSLYGNVFTNQTNLTHENSVLKIGNNVTINGAITTDINGKGTLSFAEIGKAGAIGTGTAVLATVDIGAGEVNLEDHVFATNTNLTHKNSILKLKAGKRITGAIYNTSGTDNQGTLTFLGFGRVTKNIGANGAALAEINIVDGNVNLEGDVFTEKLNFTNVDKTVTIGGDFTGGVDFGKGGTLTFNKPVVPEKPATFNSTIAGGEHGTLNVQVTLIATNAEIGNIKTINIGTPAILPPPLDAPTANTLVINASNNDVHLLAANGAEINFLHEDSELGLITLGIGNSHSIIFENNLPGKIGNGGRVAMVGIDGATLTVKANGDKALGTAARSLKHIAAYGNVIITGDGINKLDISNTKKLSIVYNPRKEGTKFVDESGTSASIAQIDIGQSKHAAGFTIDPSTDTGSATYVLDAKHGPINILSNRGGGSRNAINFIHPEARLTLRNSSDQNRMITLDNNLDPGTNDTGIVEFDSVEEDTTLTIDGVDKILGTADNKLKKIIFSGAGSFDIKPTLNTVEIELNAAMVNLGKINSKVSFISTQYAILTLKEDSTISNITTTGNKLHSLALNANLTIAGDVGSSENRLEEIKLLGDYTIAVNSKNFYSNVSTEKNNSGKVIFKSDDSVAYGNLGADKLRLSDVIFDSNSTVKADIYSKKITINADKTVTFAGIENRTIAVPGVNVDRAELPRLLKEFTYSTVIDSEEVNAKGSSKIRFDNAALVKASINSEKIILADNVWFKEKVDSTAPVSFANKYVLLEKDIKFAGIEANQAKIISLSGNQTITGDLVAKDLTIDIGTNQLKYVGNAKLTGTLQLNTFYDTSKMAGGNIEIQRDSKLDLSELDKLNIKVIARSDINKISEDTKYVLVSSVDKDGLTVIDKNKVNLVSEEQNRFVSWIVDLNTLTLSAKDISKEVLARELQELSGEPWEESREELEEAKKSDAILSEEAIFIKQLIEVTDTKSEAASYKNKLGFMNKDNAHLEIERLLSSNENLTAVEVALKDLVSIISEAISQVTSQITSRSVNILQVPIPSGDDDKIMYGVWGSPFYSTANQKMQKGVSGYNMKSAGGIVGFDGLINDDLLIGAAYSLIDTNMSHKNQKNGDKTNGKTNVFSVYGLYKFSTNWFAEGVASYGITDIKSSERRILPTNVRNVTTLGTVTAKYKSISYSGQLLTGYSYQASENLTITPTIGFRYSQFTDSGYTKTGAACQSLVVKKRSYNKFEGILGLRTSANIQLDQLLLIPELHGYVNYDFKGKSPIIDVRLDGIDKPLPIKSVKPYTCSKTA